MKRKGFDNDYYLEKQSKHILERIGQFGGKLYLEFGGKLFDDHHASRVLPGFKPDSKVCLLKTMADEAEIVIVINATDIEKSKVRGDLGITYDVDVLRLIDAFRGLGLYVGSVVISQYQEQSSAEAFIKQLEVLGIKTYKHYTIAGYPSNLSLIVSDEGLGKNDYIETTRPLVVVTAPGPGSGKMATCLSQLYHEHKRGINAGYAKFETFPIWNLPLHHPVNLAYEAATADLKDVNMIDPFHLNAYDIQTVNYNRDVEIFPLLAAMFERIHGTCTYKSPTDMGVNMAGYAITDDEACKEASLDEIVRRCYHGMLDLKAGRVDEETLYKLEMVMRQADIDTTRRSVVLPALEKATSTGKPAAAFELPCGKVITGKTSPLLGASSAVILNALKILADIPDDVAAISPSVIEPIQKLKTGVLGGQNPRLHIEETLLALSVSSMTSDVAAKVLSKLDELAGCEMHSTVILSQVDTETLRKLGVNLTCEPEYESKKLFHR